MYLFLILFHFFLPHKAHLNNRSHKFPLATVINTLYNSFTVHKVPQAYFHKGPQLSTSLDPDNLLACLVPLHVAPPSSLMDMSQVFFSNCYVKFLFQATLSGKIVQLHINADCLSASHMAGTHSGLLAWSQ